MKRREIAIRGALVVALCCASSPVMASSYAEVFAGIATATGLSSHHDREAERVKTAPVGTAIVIEGLFPLAGSLSFSPSFSFLSTGGDVKDDPQPPHSYDIRFQQSELAMDLLWQPKNLRRFRIGPGVSAAWWNAAEARDMRPYDYNNDEYPSRVVRSQSALLRGVAHLMLRNPDVTGVSLKLIGAMPMAELLQWEDSAATGYIALHIGFSMLLN